MTGFIYAVGRCWSCGQVFAFDPDKVPSIRDDNGVRQAICRTCIDRANGLRMRRGEQPHYVIPGAYPDTDDDGGLGLFIHD